MWPGLVPGAGDAETGWTSTCNGQRQSSGQDRGRSGGLRGGGRDGVGFLEGKSGANPLTDFSLILFRLEKTMEKLKNGFENKPTNAMHL